MRKEQDSADQFIIDLEEKGQRLVIIIVLINGLFLIADFIVAILMGAGSFGLFVINLFWIFVLYMLYIGQAWARWLFIIAASLNAALLLLSIPYLGEIMSMGDGAVLHTSLGIVAALIMVISALFLLFSSAVKEFLYGQETSN